MKLDFTHDRLLAVVAHPDDAELLCAGTLARAKKDGATIGICVLCSGDKGRGNKPVKNLATTRRKEMAASARLLGADLITLAQPDAALQDTPALRLRLCEIFRRFKPTLVLGHAPEDYHPDHRAASALVCAASWFCASHGNRTASPPIAAPPAVWWMDTVNMLGFNPGFFVDVSPFIALKNKMLACHRSQLQRGKDADFSPLADLMQNQHRARGLQAGVEAAEAFRAHLVFKRARAW